MATVILLIAGVVGFTVWSDVSNRPTLDAVKEYTVTRDHTTEPVTYEQTPPVGGDHNPDLAQLRRLHRAGARTSSPCTPSSTARCG